MASNIFQLSFTAFLVIQSQLDIIVPLSQHN